MGLFVALVQVYQWERLQANFFFMTNHYWGLGLMLTMCAPFRDCSLFCASTPVSPYFS